MLLCAQEHTEIDAKATQDVFTVTWLHGLKQEHEDRIKHVTGMSPSRATTVVRMMGPVHGKAVELSRQTAASAVTARHRFPLFLESYSRHGVEIDLRHTPGEEGTASGDPLSAGAASRTYYRQAVQVIDEVIRHQLRPGVERGSVQHVSVFGFARLPLLVYAIATRTSTARRRCAIRARLASVRWALPRERVHAHEARPGLTPVLEPNSHAGKKVLGLLGCTHYRQGRWRDRDGHAPSRGWRGGCPRDGGQGQAPGHPWRGYRRG